MLRSEQETIIRFDAEDTHAHIWTAHAPSKRKLERAGYKPVRTTTRDGEETGWFYDVPIADLRWKATSKRRKVSDEARKAMSERLARSRENRI